MASFSEIFDGQYMDLKRENCPQEILDVILSQKPEVLKRASVTGIKNGNIPFLPVLSSQLLFPEMNFGKSIEIISEKDVYFIYNINHHDSSHRPMQFTRKIVKEQGRAMLTLDEALSLNLHYRLVEENDKFLLCGASSLKGRPGEHPIISKKNGVIAMGIIYSWDSCSFCLTPTKEGE